MSLRIPSPVALTKPEAYLAYKAGILSRGELKDKLLNPINNYEGWLAKWCELLETYPTNEDGTPQCLTDEEGLLAYLCGVTNRYPASNSNPDDARVSAYIRYLVSARYGRPDHPLNREEFYLSLIKTQFIPSGDPSSDIVIDGTTKAPFVDVKLYGDSYQTTYSGKNLFDASTATLVNKYVNTTGGMISATDWLGIESYFEVQPNTTYTFSAKNQGARFLLGEYTTASVSSFISPRHESTGTFTTGATTHYIRFSTNNANATDLQIELGSSATPFEQYVGGTPAPNPQFPMPISVVTGENVVKVVGKNLLPLIPRGGGGSFYNQSAGKFIDTSFDSNITLTTTENSLSATVPSWEGIFLVSAPLQTGVPYHFKWDIASTGNVRATLYILDSSFTIVRRLGNYSANPTSSDATTTLNAGETYLCLSIGSNQADTVTITNPQLELGNQATSYEAFMAQDYEINLGKNLFDKDNAEIVNLYNGGSGSLSNTNAWAIIMPVKPNTTYSYSNTNPTAMKNDSSIGFYETKPDTAGVAKTGNLITIGQNGTYTFTTPSSTEWILIYYHWAAADDATAYAGLQLELGQPTAYAPYFTPLELAKIETYQDRIYKDGEKWYVEKQVGKITLNGSEGWIGAGTSFYIDSVTDYLKTGNKPFCDYFTTTINVSSAGQVSDDTLAFGAPNLSVPRLYVKYTSLFSSVSDLTTWLSTHPTTVYYALATPTTTEITNQTLIDQLNALKQGGAEEGTTYIRVSATDPNLPAKLYVEAPKYD